MAEDQGRNGLTLALDFLRAQGGQGGSAQDVLNSTLGGLGGELESILAAEQAGSSPLAEASRMTAGQMQSLLPAWARDLQVAGLGKEEQPPELFVFMRDTKKMGTTTLPGAPGTADPTQYQVEGVTGETSKAQTVTRALNQPYLWEDEELDEAMKKMQQAGLDVKTFEDVNSVWKGLVERAAITFSASEGEKKVTPWDVLDMVKRETKSEGVDGEGGEDENFTVKSTNRSIQDISEGEAWSVLQSNLSRMLGRDPGDDEIRDFAFRMNQLAAKNPAISKTVSRYKDGRLASSNTTEVDSGFTGDDMLKAAYDSAQQDSEYAEYQGATTYFNALQSALGEIGG